MQNRPQMLAPDVLPPLAGSTDKTVLAAMAGSNGAHGKGSA